MYLLCISICIGTMFMIILPLQCTPLQIGDHAPYFTAYDAQGQIFSLEKSLKKSRYVILCFYPKDNTPVCTAELCAIRDRYSTVPDDITIVGISKGSSDTHHTFATTYRIPFPLLIDSKNSIRHLYKAYTWWLIPARITYVVDHRGVIIKMCDALSTIDQHIALIESVIAAQNR